MKKILIGIIIIIIIIIGFIIFKISSNKKVTVLSKPPIQNNATGTTSNTINQQKNTTEKTNPIASEHSINNNSTKSMDTTKISKVSGVVQDITNNNSTNSISTPKTLKVSGAVQDTNTYGYTYGSINDLNNISGVYNFSNFAKGKNPNSLQDLSAITINLNGVTLDNDITGNNIYESSEKIRIYQITSNDFTTMFGVTPASIGLQGNNFNVDAIGKVFIYQLPSKNILFSFESGAGNAINTTNNIATSNVSKWYGNYTISNKVGEVNGINNYGQSPVNLTGKKIVIENDEFKYENKIINNPQYYIIKVRPSALLGTSYSGADLTEANTADFLAVLGSGEKMSNFLYNALPSYTGCMSGAWAAGIAMPILLGPNGNIQVINNNCEIYSSIKNS